MGEEEDVGAVFELVIDSFHLCRDSRADGGAVSEEEVHDVDFVVEEGVGDVLGVLVYEAEWGDCWVDGVSVGGEGAFADDGEGC